MKDKDLRTNFLEERGNDVNPSTKNNKIFEGQKYIKNMKKKSAQKAPPMIAPLRRSN